LPLGCSVQRHQRQRTRRKWLLVRVSGAIALACTIALTKC
jgi:succinate dehydrogenase hydrophobic anchor subunit